MSDATEINRIVRGLLRQEQQDAQTLNIISAKIKDPNLARQLQEIANRQQQTADGLSRISNMVNNESNYAGTGVLNKAGYAPDDGTPGGSYTEVLTNYDGSGRAE